MTEICGFCKDTHGRHFLWCHYYQQEEIIRDWRKKKGYTPEMPLRTDGAHMPEECGKIPVGHEYQGVVGPAPLTPTGQRGDISTKEAINRKKLPVATGVVDYFPDALKEVAGCSYSGNEQHNPGQALHWSRGKSDDHPDCLMRHFIDRGTFDVDGVRHSAKVAWRALAILQIEIEAEHGAKKT